MARSKQQVQEQSTFEVAKLQDVSVVNVFKEVTNEVDNDLRSPSAMFKAVRKYKAKTAQAIEARFLKNPGRYPNMARIDSMLNGDGEFKLFLHFLTSKTPKVNKKEGTFTLEAAKDKARFSYKEGVNACLKAAMLTDEQIATIEL